MEHKGTQTLKTPRLTLRQFASSDVPAAWRNWCADEAVTRYLTWPPHADETVTGEVIESWVRGYADPAFYQWAIELNDLREPIGSISVVEKDERTGSVSIGYCIGKRWWRQGITTEAFRAVIRYLFETVCAKRIEARHNVNNPNSGRVMRACGLTYEGTLRQAMVDNQGAADVCVYSILRSEYDAQKQNQEAGKISHGRI